MLDSQAQSKAKRANGADRPAFEVVIEKTDSPEPSRLEPSIHTTTSSDLEFEVLDWRVRPQLNQLEHENVATRIEGRAMAVLVVLAENQGVVCSKRRIIDAVWGSAFVTDDVLTHAIWEIRRALGDEPKQPRFIETIPRKGYRLLPSVTWTSRHAKEAAKASFPYKILGKIGAGGMGVVYLAESTRLRRPVALKFLSPGLTGSAQAQARLRREAQSAAALQHPNIATVYDVGEDPQGQLYIAMAFYEGETLDKRLLEGPIAIADAIRFGTLVASGLAAAHHKGILHRDIKPANLLVGDDGSITILDFGLARTADQQATALTQTDATPGTVSYMSPERLRGEALDPRSDLWSLGVVLYEMLTGATPFDGPSSHLLVQSVLHDAPTPVRLLRSDAPTDLVRLLDALLEKDPADRPQDATTVLERFESLPRSAESRPSRPTGIGLSSALRRWRASSTARWIWIAAAAVGIALLVGSLPLRRSAPTNETSTAHVVAFDLSPPPGVAFAEGVDSSPAISPTGAWVAFVGTDDEDRRALWIKSLDGTRGRRLPDTRNAGQPFWSPDERSLGFFADRKLRIVSLSGGPPRTLAETTTEYRGGSWGADGSILFAPGSRDGIFVVPPDATDASPLTAPDRGRGEIGHLWPAFLPDGERFLYFVSSNDPSVEGIHVATLERPRGTRLLASSVSALAIDGHLLHLQGTTLMASPFEGRLNAPITDVDAVVDGVASFFTYQGVFSASANGVLVYSKASSVVPTTPRWLDRRGEILDTLPAMNAYRKNPSLSGDGRFLAFEVHEGSRAQIAVVERETGRSRRITNTGNQAHFPLLSPDGAALTFVVEESDGSTLYLTRLNNASSAMPLYEAEGLIVPADWSSDGTSLLLSEQTGRGDYDLVMVSIDATDPPAALLQSESHELNARFSPAGDLMTYASNETGSFEIYLETIPGSGHRCQVSSGGGFDAHWSRRGDTISYLSLDGRLMEARLESFASCAIGQPTVLFDPLVEPPLTSRNHFVLDKSSGHYLVNSKLEAPPSGKIGVLVNWKRVIETNL